MNSFFSVVGIVFEEEEEEEEEKNVHLSSSSFPRDWDACFLLYNDTKANKIATDYSC